METKALLIVFIAASSLLITPYKVEAIGGGRGGGRGSGAAKGGGAYRGGHTINRTPTMSRASTRPAASQASRPQPQSRPSLEQSPQTVQKSSAATRAQVSTRVNRLEQSRLQKVDRQDLENRKQGFSSQRSDQMVQNRQLSDKVSQRLHQSRPVSNDWFNQNFFNSHNVGWDYGRRDINWWKPVGWAALADYWRDWGWSSPYYYDDWGYSYPITDSSYSYLYSTTTYPENYIIMSQDWLPLGVFAVASDINTVAQTNHFIQLAVNRQGEISGVLYNSTTDAAYELIGMVDPKTQKAYWYMSGNEEAPISSTGIYNLTEDLTPINVQFSDGTEQPWILVRLQQER